jgi:Mg-chelatase subunit ChlD
LKICSNCAASNVNSAEFCSECALVLANVTVRDTFKGDPHPSRKRGIKLPARRKIVKQSMDPARRPGTREFAATLLEIESPLDARRADVMFILDCTESMGGEIDAIRDAIIGFVEALHQAGLAIRVGLIEFRDRLINEEQRVLQFAGQPFTNDAELFRTEAMTLSAWGGGDAPESSLDAVLLAVRQPFDPLAQKILVLITDAPPHVPDREARSVEEVAQAVRAAMISQFYLIIPVREADNHVYLQLCRGTRGIAFDLGKGADFKQRAEDFKRTLMSLGKTISAATV